MVDTPKTIRIEPDDAERFEILGTAGTGGMGVVYRARDLMTGQTIALKILNATGGDLTRFTLEAQILAKLDHPSIVGYRDHGVTKEGRPYLAMEWVDGENLEERLDRGPIPLTDTLRMMRAIADALATAHEAGIIHRDLKPTNVLITRESHIAKLADFGIARSSDVDGLTLTGVTLGTPGYMSPEQARGEEIDARSDLFSFGCVLFRCVAGRRPFPGADLVQYATNLALDEAPALRDVAPAAPLALAALVNRLLQKVRAGRLESARQVVDALDRIANADETTSPVSTVVSPELPVMPVHTTRSPTASDRKKRRFGPLLALALLVGAGIGLVVLRFGTTPRLATAPLEAAAAEPPSARADGNALDTACRDWAGVIAQGQKPDGAFAGEARSEATGWDTAQQLFALTRAHRACGGASLVNIVSGVHALAKLHELGGLVGPKRMPARAPHGETPANAWALLALIGASHATPDPDTEKTLARAHADVLAGRNADGGFRFDPIAPGPSSAYSTLLATWALSEQGQDPDAVRAATDWLQDRVLAGAPETLEPGFTEQLAWVTSRVNLGAKLDDVRRAFAKDIVSHCRPDAAGLCARPAHDTGRLVVNSDGGRIVTFWHPWATLAARELSGRTSAIDEPTAHTLASISRWGAAQLGRSAEELASIQEYKLAEYLIVVSELLLAGIPD